jgi:hypothetical protein
MSLYDIARELESGDNSPRLELDKNRIATASVIDAWIEEMPKYTRRAKATLLLDTAKDLFRPKSRRKAPEPLTNFVEQRRRLKRKIEHELIDQFVTKFPKPIRKFVDSDPPSFPEIRHNLRKDRCTLYRTDDRSLVEDAVRERVIGQSRKQGGAVPSGIGA